MRVRKAIAQMGHYTPPLEGRNPDQYLLMDFNESPLPPPPGVTEALQHFLSQERLHLYPSYGTFLQDLGAYVGVPEEQVLITNGSDQGIELVMRALLEPGDNFVMPVPGFAMFAQVAQTLGAEHRAPQFPLDTFAFPLEAVQDAVDARTRLIVVISPNNPTGTVVPLEAVEHLLTQFPDCAVLVDEAYFEFNGLTAVPLLKRFPNLVVLRTFSKAFALPGLRLGYVVAQPEFLAELSKIRGPYDVNMLSVVAGHAALNALPVIRQRVQHLMEEAKPALEQFFEDEEVRFYQGGANFMLVEPPDAPDAIRFLKEHGVLVRPMRPPIAHTFRLNVRMLPEVERFIEIFREYLQVSQLVVT